MAANIHISFQGAIYYAKRSDTDDVTMMQLFSKKLAGVARETTFNVLYSQLSREWRQQDDLTSPFHDRRGSHIDTVWTFDLDGDCLRFDKKDRNLYVAITLLRLRAVTISDFQPYELPALPRETSHALFRSPLWNMKQKAMDMEKLERQSIFVGKILTDFAHQWRHILNSYYSIYTFRRLACATIKIATLDFQVIEATSPRRGNGGFLVWIHDLPQWDPFPEQIVRVGSTSVVIAQHMRPAVASIRRDFEERNVNGGAPEDGFVYLILSMKEVVLFRISNESESYSKPEPLFDGDNAPSQKVVGLLLMALQPIVPKTPFLGLPTELQDMILYYISQGPVERARVGCLLNAGSKFAWKSGNREIMLEEGHRHGHEGSPVESAIYFGKHHSGIAYK